MLFAESEVHLLVPIEFAAGTSTCRIGPRTVGSLTGSRSAAAWGRIPIEEAFSEVVNSFPHTQLGEVSLWRYGC